MHSFLFFVLTLGLLLNSEGWACSVPLPSAEKQAPAPTAVQLIEANHYRKALALLTSSPVQNATNLLLLSRAQLGLGELGPAMESAEKALAADPKNAAVHVQVAAVAGRMAEHASMFRQLSLAKRVKRELDEALALDAKNADAIYGLVLYCDLAPSFMGGDKEKARDLAGQLASIAPARGYLVQATLAHNDKNSVDEETLLKKAVAAEPDSYDAHIALAVFQSKANPARAEQADEQACQALYIDPARPEAWQILAEQAAPESLREMDGLLSVYRKFDPDDLSPAYHAAVGLIAAGKNLDVAEALLKHYLELPPDGGAPSAGLAHYQLALIAGKLGHNDQAAGLIRVAISEDATLEDAKKELKRLEQAKRTEPDRTQ